MPSFNCFLRCQDADTEISGLAIAAYADRGEVRHASLKLTHRKLTPQFLHNIKETDTRFVKFSNEVLENVLRESCRYSSPHLE